MSRNGKFAMTTNIEPKMISGRATMKPSRSAVRYLLLFSLSAIGSSTPSRKLMNLFIISTPYYLLFDKFKSAFQNSLSIHTTVGNRIDHLDLHAVLFSRLREFRLHEAHLRPKEQDIRCRKVGNRLVRATAQIFTSAPSESAALSIFETRRLVDMPD